MDAILAVRDEARKISPFFIIPIIIMGWDNCDYSMMTIVDMLRWLTSEDPGEGRDEDDGCGEV
jgi:hypothetical protein